MPDLSYPALAAWRRRDGHLPATEWRLDNLWRAACWEQSAQAARARGSIDAANADLHRARALMVRS